MTEVERALLDTLRDLESASRSMATAHPRPDLLPLFARIDELTRALPRGTDPDLLHYLHRKSYQKAHEWLARRAGE